jgi:NAD(P)-dependent dehydrogenase (short-subunit alcohol dehydrogenase family)
MRLAVTEFADKAGLVTAGTQGIGADIVRRLAREGARVALTYCTAADRALVQRPQFREQLCPHD